MTVRAAAFTSLTPGADLARLAREQDASCCSSTAPAGLLEDARLLSLLDEAACDVAVLVDGASRPIARAVRRRRPRLVRDRARRVARAHTRRTSCSQGRPRLPDGRDASRLLASASLAVQRALGVHAEPLLVEPDAQALVDAARTASLVVVRLTERWRRDGVGQARTALATSPDHPTLLVRRGLRPGGLAPDSAATRFTWTVVG